MWFIGIAAVLIVLAVVIVGTERPAPMPYSAFFDQLEAGNVASATFQGTQIDGRFKRPLDGALSTGTTQRDSFSTRVPDIGDPADAGCASPPSHDGGEADRNHAVALLAVNSPTSRMKIANVRLRRR